MTIINVNSISGISSITAQGASGIEFFDSSGNSVQTVTGDGLTVGTGASVHNPASNVLTLGTNNEERIRINSTGHVGIGTDNPSDALTVYKTNVGNPAGITIRNTEASSTYSHARLRLESQNGAAYGEIWADVANAGLRLGYNSSSTVKIDSTGNIVLLSGKGINFHNYGTGTNINSNLLDDYEEGTFDPSFTSTGGTLTSSNTSLNYVKVGRIVTVTGRLQINAVSTPTGTVTITLPFAYTTTPTGTGSPFITHGQAYLHGQLFPADYSRAFWELSAPPNRAALYYERDNTAWQQFPPANFAVNDYIAVNITYHTDL